MKFHSSTLLLGALAGTAAARPAVDEKPMTEFSAMSAPQAVAMSTLRAKKTAQFEADAAAGLYDLDRYALQAATTCSNGTAGEYKCNNVDLKGFLRHQDLQSRTRGGNDIWGWASGGREFGLVGQTDGTAFVEVLNDGSLIYIGRLDTATVASSWRDIKVIGNYAYIGSEAADHGLQIFDLRKLLTVDPKSPVTFRKTADLAAHFTGFGSSHNIVANPDTNTIFAVGTQTSLPCRGGLWMIDVSNPLRPQDSGCVNQDGYVHDAQCVIYNGPMAQYKNKEICFNFNEDSLTIVDITRRALPTQLSKTTYKGATYTHQGWLATSDHRYLLLDDELDEQNGNGPAADGHTTTYIVDITDLTWPVFRGVYKSPVRSIDHNQYVINGLSYQSNYGSGLRIVDVSSVTSDDTGAAFNEVGFFDVRPEDDNATGGGEVSFNGAWSVYPYLPSGYLLVNSIERGVYSLKYNA